MISPARPGPRPVTRRRNYSYNLRLIRRTMPYSIQEVADLYHLHPNAVRRWLRNGLKVVEQARPYLIHGGDLIDFLQTRQQQRRRPSEPGQMYCCSCRASRYPTRGGTTLDYLTAKQVVVRGRCELCGTRMQQFGAAKRLEQLALEFAATSPPPLLTDTADLPAQCQIVQGNRNDRVQPEE